MISVGNGATSYRNIVGEPGAPIIRRMLKKATFSPAPPWRAKTRLVPNKAVASYHFIWGGWDDSNCARPTRAF